MEDVLEPEPPDQPQLSNGVASPAPPEQPDEPEEAPRVNGDAESCSSESDALVIDEGASVTRKAPPAPPEPIHHFNPYFNESIVELSRQHLGHRRPKKSPKLQEYAQYLGLQPAVQFKCSRCGRAGFESLTTLNEHVIQCTDEPSEEPQRENSGSSFKLTRKVFLCSACGTYYENWNLYVHMLEVHRRYLCLYCLGMFSVLDDLCLHIQSRHNLEPGYKESPDDFFSAYREPCYIVCCECNKHFSEQDNFFYHNCIGKNKNANQKKVLSRPAKQQIRPEDHVTGETLINGDCSNQPTIDSATVNVDSEIHEIIYSTDDELDFRGFTETGEPVHTVKEKMVVEEEPVETRKVPKLSLKLKLGSFPQIEQHDEEEPEEEEEIEEEKQENEVVESENEYPTNDETQIDINQEPEMKIASEEINIIELELEQPLDKFEIRILLQKCLNATTAFCIYCNHARKIAVNGKQLGLHAIAEHRFSAVVHSITAEELIPESFVSRIKDALPELENVFFSLESSPSDEAVTFSHIFECFQCRYATTVHKELYLHNRKCHAKNLLLCIMCKCNFYSYSELICHLCPGVYILDYDVGFRCCMCVSDDLPSAFRLMVHLRKRHHVCDVCLEMCHNQSRLSNHVWKHKLHHFCYRCGIAYRNKPDITRHLFWKHGTESVLCKKCLQKKWPHMYHFCVPPTSFTCEECNLTFSRAIYLKVHKRIHNNEKPHSCNFENCEEKFISKKLRDKHERKHLEPPEEPKEEIEEKKEESKETQEENKETKEDAKIEEKVKPKVDVYDLPALNLSESDSSDSEEEKVEKKEEIKETIVTEEIAEPLMEEEIPSEENQIVLDNIWDNFKNYQANKEKFDSMLNENDKPELEVIENMVEQPLTVEAALRDHDYCVDPENKPDVSFTEVKPDLSQSVDHDYCTAKNPTGSPKPIEENKEPEVKEPPKKRNDNSSSSDSSSDSSSTCSCGPNCSCSSSSGSSSSSSDSSDSDSSTEEGRKRQQLRREKRRQKKKGIEPEVKVDIITNDNQTEMPILESDLESTESETDEEFYDKKPHLIAKKILEEKRNQLLAGIEQTPNGSLLENIPEEDKQVKKKKSKSKKKKKKKSERKEGRHESYHYYQPQPTVAPITLTIRNSPIQSPIVKNESEVLSRDDADGNLRASKRRRVPNKFYGYSSDEEEEKQPKWRKSEPPPPPQLVPPITIKTSAPTTPNFRYQTKEIPVPRKMPTIKLKTPKIEEVESEAESNDSSNEGRNMLQVNPDALYCYCKCPYDEVSEMIGCDSRDCDIEWFHFECVGIMVPPKGHWYCPECRKKRQQKREALKLKGKTT